MLSPSRAAAQAIAKLSAKATNAFCARAAPTASLTTRCARGPPRRHIFTRHGDPSPTRSKRGNISHRGMPTVVAIPENAERLMVKTPGFPDQAITVAWTSDIMYVQGADWDAVRPMWLMTLRDSCQCAKCRDPASGNKRYEATEIPSALRIDGVRLVDAGLVVTFGNDIPWLADGDLATHETLVPWRTLDVALRRRGASEESQAPRTRSIAAHTGIEYWDAATLEGSVRQFDFGDFMRGGDTFWEAVVDLCRLGIVWLRDVPRDERSVAAVTTRIANVRETFYGRTFDVRAKPDAENVAYTSASLGLHQDLLYLSPPPLIQVLHCMDNSCAGGESLFSDVHRAAALLWPYVQASSKLAPLAELRIPYHYVNDGFSYRASRPVFDFTPADGVLVGVNWSPPFQAPHVFAGVDIHPWLQAARLFQSIFSAEDAVYSRKMRPGECVIFNNQRVLHGRTAFDAGSGGSRWLRGAYIAPEDFNSRAAHIPTDLAAARRGTTDLWSPTTAQKELRKTPWYEEVNRKVHSFDMALYSRMIW
ncbi:hypothetical protein HIM_06098 [Hirsutella minnesotensis 3608]|uniref:TauD/TfdA-like domain-containing protein n=1 Tax=Hirsutella minnesotensis 3608 TaxID=1043627 RepID=A0A0F7ZZM9_9HYPO|nr:hypothetical protein HIM_06098 [Hirsutella minnesotensis 3608]